MGTLQGTVLFFTDIPLILRMLSVLISFCSFSQFDVLWIELLCCPFQIRFLVISIASDSQHFALGS